MDVIKTKQLVFGRDLVLFGSVDSSACDTEISYAALLKGPCCPALLQWSALKILSYEGFWCSLN